MVIREGTTLADLRRASMERGDGPTTGWVHAMMRQGCVTVGDLREWAQPLGGDQWSFAYGSPPFIRARTVRGVGAKAAQAILDVLEECV